MWPEHGKNKISQWKCPASHSYSIHSDIINMRPSAINNGLFAGLSADVIILQINGNNEKTTVL